MNHIRSLSLDRLGCKINDSDPIDRSMNHKRSPSLDGLGCKINDSDPIDPYLVAVEHPHAWWLFGLI